MNEIILASKSPRRYEILQKMLCNTNYILTVMPSNKEEPIGETATKDLAVSSAEIKAKDIAKKVDKGIVIGADTVVVLGNRVLGKPKEEADAYEMLSALSGKTHEVITGICAIDVLRDTIKKRSVITEVTFRNLSEDEIRNYIKTKECMDKAGSYGIQGVGGFFVERIKGSYSNVVGLPKTELYLMLKELGIDLL